jgi:hypothetical protein
MAMLSAGTSAVTRSPFCRIAPEGAFCKTEEDSFLLLKSTLRSMEEILRRSCGLPLRRTWIEQPYGEEKVTLLEEELIPAIQQCLARIDELDQRLLSEQELLQRSLSCVCRWPEGHRRGGLRPPSFNFPWLASNTASLTCQDYSPDSESTAPNKIPPSTKSTSVL